MTINKALKEKIKKQKEDREKATVPKKSKATQLKEALFYDWKREQLSRTALMNFCFFGLTVITWVTMIPVMVWVIIHNVNTGKPIPISLIIGFFTFITTVTGLGGFQYTAGKKINHGEK